MHGDGLPELVAGWLAGATRIDSPNFDARPACDVDLIVIHSISLPPSQYGGGYIDQLFLNRLDPAAHPYFRSVHDLKVSSHFLIGRDGDLKQFISTERRAWHCGESSFAGRNACNDFSIGIELEGCDEHSFMPAQYDVLNELLVSLSGHYPITTTAQIVGHCDIAPGRKPDPGPLFDWEHVRKAWRTACARKSNRDSR